ncbi:DUF262 domain-containing protein [Corynebacterium guangdongense]|uniref:GmrSD restriction endonucleases N-terminal domain-containing protein n=1 Tax=Corynebacterium guangdongense TaxID=1783348 RepID=A0ABU1ZZX2_9CORY|nr:DUF262 domain-containing protein [Corynebacterium guangdongense]MDR7329938.1 hypothetical protein [Corynebacterium guangdongense]
MSDKSETVNKILKEIAVHGASFDSKTSDLNPKSVADWVDENVIDLGPNFQRRDRWDETRQSRLIESVILGIPIPPAYLSSEPNQPYGVIDGKQRITAIHKFMSNELVLTDLELIPSLNGLKYEDLPFDVTSRLRVEPAIRAVIIIPKPSQDEELTSDGEAKYEVFHRLNTGGIQLEPQEIRNNNYRGPFNELLIELAEDSYMQKQLKVRETDEAYKKMDDIEYVLRFFTLAERWSVESGFGQLRNELDDYMRQHRFADDSELQAFRKKYSTMRDRAESLFGEYAFRRWTASNGIWRDQQNIAVYDAESIALSELSDTNFEALSEKKSEVLKKVKQLFTKDQAFSKAIQGSTGSLTSIHTRVNAVKDVFEGCL